MRNSAGPDDAPGTARAMSGGAPCDFAYVIETLTCAAQMARTRAGPGA